MEKKGGERVDEEGREWRKFWEEEYAAARVLADRRLSDFMEVRIFASWSRGRDRPRRRWPRTAILIRLKGGSKGWRFWCGTDRRSSQLHWDVWAGEIYGPEYCDGLSARGVHSEDDLRQEVLRMAKEKSK